MELPKIGVNCSEIDCKQLDFLPFKCDQCGKMFCSQHYTQHHVDEAAMNSCCSSSSSQHNKIIVATTTMKQTNSNKCSESDCKEINTIPIECPNCGQYTCVKHRHLTTNGGCHGKTSNEIAQEREKYAAPVRQFTEAKIVSDQQIATKLSKAKNRTTALQIQLMRLKGKAVGMKTIPIDDRAYFNVTQHCDDKITAKTTSTSSKALFVSRLWTIGRVIDAIANEMQLINNNNNNGGKNKLLLRLFRASDGQIVTRNQSDKLIDLLMKSSTTDNNNSQLLMNGDNLIIAYVNDSDNHILL